MVHLYLVFSHVHVRFSKSPQIAASVAMNGTADSNSNTLAINGFTLRRKNIELLNLAQSLLYKVDEKEDTNLFNPISGGYFQLNLIDQPLSTPFLQKLVLVLDQVLKESDVVTTNFTIKSLKLLVAPPKSGPQAPHRDGLSKDHYVAAFYCTKTDSTDMSTYYIGRDKDAQSMMENKDLDVLKGWSSMTHYAVDPGDLMVFHEDVIHRGIHNISDDLDRLVIFAVYGPKGDPHNDDYQHFEWSHAETVYGTGSHEHLEALSRNVELKFDPFAHEACKKRKRNLQTALRKWKGKKRSNETSKRIKV